MKSILSSVDETRLRPYGCLTWGYTKQGVKVEAAAARRLILQNGALACLAAWWHRLSLSSFAIASEQSVH